jgi:hypothetical protein
VNIYEKFVSEDSESRPMQDVKIIIHNILKYVKIKLPGYYISEMD